MRKFLIKVNENQYEVEVEEVKKSTNKTIQRRSKTEPTNPSTGISAISTPSVQRTEKEGVSKVCAPIPGTILRVDVASGDTAKKGQVLLILEAMKMENEVTAPKDGKLVSVNVEKGARVNAGDVLVTIE